MREAGICRFSLFKVEKLFFRQKCDIRHKSEHILLFSAIIDKVKQNSV